MDAGAYKLTAFGQLCADRRVVLTMTRPELAKLVGTTPTDISLIERGEKEPPAHYVLLIIEVLRLEQAEVEFALAAQGSTYRLTRVTQPRYGSQQ